MQNKFEKKIYALGTYLFKIVQDIIQNCIHKYCHKIAINKLYKAGGANKKREIGVGETRWQSPSLLFFSHAD